VIEVITKCKDYQFFQKQTMKHSNPLQPNNISWPFAIWEFDIMGILPRAPGGFIFLFVTIDTFTKWMEAMQLANITQEAVVKFLQSIIYRFGVPRRVLTDNETQLKGAKFVRYCANFGIHISYRQQHILRRTGKLNEQIDLFCKGRRQECFMT
jgi:hypothetical protein